MKVRDFDEIGELNDLHREAVFETENNGKQIIPAPRIYGEYNKEKFYCDYYRPSPYKGQHTKEILVNNNIDKEVVDEICELYKNSKEVNTKPKL